MHRSLSVGDVMRREFVGVSEGDSVKGVADVMHREGVDGAIVLRGSNPIGVFGASDVVAAVARGEDPGITTVDAVMRQPVISVDPDDDLWEAAEAMADRDVRRVAVVSAGEIVGVLREHDVLTAPGILSPIGSSDSAEPQDHTREQDSEVIGSEDPAHTTQGVCEVCGALSRTLDPHNGKLVCEECRPV